jgi:peptide/nickel transport system substrate-binding protein
MPNQNTKDPVLQKIFRDKRFRMALSHALDRDEMNNLFFLGVCKPRQATVIPQCRFYEPDLEMMYATFEPDKANALLDEMGLKKGADGIRLRPDGKQLAFTILGINLASLGPWPDILEFGAQQWTKILGIKAEAKIIDRPLYTQRYQANDIEVGGWAWGRGLTPLISPTFVFPSTGPVNTPAPLYATWYQSGGKSGEEPPKDSDFRKAMDLYDRYVQEADDAKRLAIGKELIRLSTESLWSIGTVGELPDPVIVKNNMGNVPKQILAEHLLANPANAKPEQWYFKD